MKIWISLLVTLLSFHSSTIYSSSETDKNFILLRCRDTGMFSIFNDVLSLLHSYENGFYAGVQVDFEQSGLYYDPQYGSNWWCYYCEPIFLGKKNKALILETTGTELPHAIPREKLRAFNKYKAYQMIEKHIHLKPHIKEKIDKFVKKNFHRSFIIGVHYRGTDKFTEAPRVSYKKIKKCIEKEIAKLKNNNYKIFIATDEINFVNYMSLFFSDKICYYEEAIRSKNKTPVHYQQKDGYSLGEGAIIDCILLSKAHLLIRTSSSLSLWSTYFNPTLPVIEMSQRYVP